MIPMLVGGKTSLVEEENLLVSTLGIKKLLTIMIIRYSLSDNKTH